MEVLLNQQETYDQLYNCTFYDPNVVPVEERQQPVLATIIFPIGTVSFILYLACLYAMFKKDNRCRASYKLMILLAFFHLYGIILSGMVTAYFYFYGTVFCEMPTLIYVLGAYGTATWIGATITGCLLSLNRCCEMYSHYVAEKLFGNSKVYFWMLIPVSIYLYCFVFTEPLLFSGIAMSWYFNPHHKYYDDVGGVYHNNLHTLNNTVTLFLEIVFSLTFVYLYIYRVKAGATRMSTSDKLMCLQVFIIGLFELFAGVTFLLQQRYSLSFELTMVAGVGYFGSQGVFLVRKWRK
ncbi:unnamed protein product [Bursaphelenchus okinawaensis]|uniref:Serpentine receptor class gamma n=1 Tax=Bursaphelenchus okinawaensis TaxID=465554 RepID=A0A811LUU7_9BILA|nr:unnamed protein product [Bursaphelenchus okinawaensis]CAG9127991.1 unnamed protein product [Bursaphelenchus okinawaensis]